MTFAGFQKLTLLDFPGVVACTLFTQGCNFRCPFCHNASLVMGSGEMASYGEEEILTFLQKRQGILEGVCITGGEPLMHPGLGDFLRRVKALGYRVKLDTNGSYPDRLQALASKGLLDYVAMDVKNRAEKYSLTAGGEGMDLTAVEASMDFLLAGSLPYEFRTTVARELHTVEDIESIARRIAGAEGYFIQNFKDSGSILAGPLSPVDEDTLAQMCEAGGRYTKICKSR